MTAARKIMNRLEKAYPEAKIALRYKNPLELLVATILAAQCTDERVNQVTASLFKKYGKASDYARAPVEELMEAVRPTGFFRNKSRNIQAACRVIEREHKGIVPDTMEELVELPGVARKTANVVLGNAYGIASGIVVDTHVLRVSKRLGLTREKDPVKVERDLCELIPKKKWISVSHLITAHGRAVCKARSPRCPDCVVGDLCPSRELFVKGADTARKAGAGRGRKKAVAVGASKKKAGEGGRKRNAPADGGKKKAAAGGRKKKAPAGGRMKKAAPVGPRQRIRLGSRASQKRTLRDS
jgi:endonuclease-3